MATAPALQKTDEYLAMETRLLICLFNPTVGSRIGFVYMRAAQEWQTRVLDKNNPLH